MKRIPFFKKLILCLALLPSAAVFAEANTVRTCQLTEWCALPRISDVAIFPVTKSEGRSYNCTFTVEGSDSGKSVMAQMIGTDGYNTSGALTIGTFEGHSAIVTVNGDFQNSDNGKLNFRRLLGMSNSKKVFIMCEKKFTP